MPSKNPKLRWARTGVRHGLEVIPYYRTTKRFALKALTIMGNIWATMIFQRHLARVKHGLCFKIRTRPFRLKGPMANFCLFLTWPSPWLAMMMMNIPSSISLRIKVVMAGVSLARKILASLSLSRFTAIVILRKKAITIAPIAIKEIHQGIQGRDQIGSL